MTTPSAHDGKSWSNAANGSLQRIRPLRYNLPRCSFALVSIENQGLPTDSYCLINSPIRQNWASRSACSPPERCFEICRCRIPASSSQVAIASLPTGVPIEVSNDDKSRGVKWVKRTSSLSGSPDVPVSKGAIKFCSSIDSDSIFFFARHLGAGRDLPLDRRPTG